MGGTRRAAFGIDVDAVSPRANAAFSLVVSRRAPLTGSGEKPAVSCDGPRVAEHIKLLGRDFHWRQPEHLGRRQRGMNTIDIHLSDPTAHLILTFGTGRVRTAQR